MFQRLLHRLRHATPPGDARRRHLAEYNTRDARDLFSHLLQRVRRGEEIVIAHAGRPVAKLVPYAGEPTRPGLVRTQLVVEDIVVLDPHRKVLVPPTPTRWWREASR